MIFVASESVLAIWSALAPSHDIVAVPQDDLATVLETIRRHRPTLVVLEEAFAVSPEAAAFVARLQRDPEFRGVELRVLTPPGAATLRSARADARPAINLAALTRPMPRRAARIRPVRPVDILIDGQPATLVNVSQSGTQVCSTVVLRPRQRVRLSFPLADRAPIRTQGVVIWSAFERAAPPTYRAGINLTGPLPLAAEELVSRLAPD